ncbi:MAG: hypothetical protein KDC45_01365 [Bacteroidetes bacterium]|nr:hypothetical protein [Bacteroidota bacterium]
MKRAVAFTGVIVALCSCAQPVPRGGHVVVALSSDASVLNPLIATGSNTSTVLQFLFTELVEHDFDSETGTDSLIPRIAKSWSWSEDRKSLTYQLRADLRWSDGVPITAHDIAYSYRLLGYKEIPSVRKGKLDHFVRSESGEIDWDRAVLARNDSTIEFRFDSAYRRENQLDDTQMAFVPGHIFRSMDVSKVASSEFNSKPVTANQFRLKTWNKKQEIVLERDPGWLLPHAAHLDEVVFRVIPDMTARLVELQTGGVDMVEGLTPAQALEVSKNGNCRIERQENRRLEYIGWSNIDQTAYRKDKTIRPHPLFGDARVRKALTTAIDRDLLVQAALESYGRTADGPVSPAFRWAVNDTLRPISYDPDLAKRMLSEAGWFDHDGDGILDRNGISFEFTLTTNSGNERRAFVAERVRDALERIGIRVHVLQLESNAYNTGLRNREFDAFIAGQVVNLGLELQNQFGSDLEKNSFNVAGFQNRSVDSLLERASTYWRLVDAAHELKQVQAILLEEQPITFLYWYDNLIAIRNRLQGTHVSILSPYHRFYDWYVKE